jgi:hypothetical protein
LLVLQARKAFRAYRVFKAFKALLDRQAFKALLALQVQQDLLVQTQPWLAQQVPQAHKGLKAFKVILVG